MKQIEKEIMQIPGNTPLIKIDNIYAKLECTNPCGSIKDRMAKYILDRSEELGLLKPGMKIVEGTSGNTGIAFSYYGRQKGYDVTIVMPENMTDERKQIIRDLGARLILCSKEGSFGEAIQIRDELAQKPDYFTPDQFSNQLNVECHYKTTGQEIIAQIKKHADKVDALVAGIGTGGTLIGIGKALKEVNPEVCLVAVEPTESAVMTGGEPGSHSIQGIGDGFIPPIAQGNNQGLTESISEVQTVSSEEAHQSAKELESKHGYCVGISSGANFVAAQRMTKRFKTVVTIFPDGYLKYLSQGLKRCIEGQCEYEAEPAYLGVKKD